MLPGSGKLGSTSTNGIASPTTKRDERGGADVVDVLNLVAPLKSLEFVEAERPYRLGASQPRRGLKSLSHGAFCR